MNNSVKSHSFLSYFQHADSSFSMNAVYGHSVKFCDGTWCLFLENLLSTKKCVHIKEEL